MSQTPHKSTQKMCKSPKSYQNVKPEKIDYENLSTNCTVVGSNNLNLVKKPQIVASMSPAYSNPSPGYPQSPYSSPASLKSPSPSLKPPTPQPAFPVMQIIHNSHPLLARPIQSQPQNIIKLKPHLNILPKPSASPQPSPKPSVSPQIVIPTNHHQQATLMQSAQPLLLNQMPMLATTPGVQFILRPQAAKIPTQMSAAATPQGLILQPSGQQLLQLQTPRSQPMVRVLTNSVQLAPSTTTYVTAQPPTSQPAQEILHSPHQHNNTHVKKKPKTKVKKKLDLANIMKLSGIGDEDDIQFESDASQSESEPTTPQPQQMHSMHAQTNLMQAAAVADKKIGNIQISGIAQPTINATAATPVVQVLNQNFQSGMISNSTSQTAAQAACASIPFNPFITPNFTINNGLMVQRSGGFKLTVGEDGRLVLQHDPTLNQDLQSQLILQSIFGLNSGLVLQPSLDQQTVQQTVQTIQQQSVQTIQQQTVQSQTIQTVQQQTVQPQTIQQSIQALQPQIQQQTVQQTIQHQTVQSQPLTATLQQPMQIVQPQPIHSMQSQVQPSVHSLQSHVHSLQSQIQGQIHSLLHQQSHAPTIQAVQPQPIQTLASMPQQSPQHQQPQQHTQPILKVQPFQKSQLPVQTVHPVQQQPQIQAVQPQQIQAVQPQPAVQQQQPIQAIHGSGQDGGPQGNQPTSFVVNLTPDQLEQLKRNGQLTVNGQTIFMQRPNATKNDNSDKKLSPKIKPASKKINKIQNTHPVKNLVQENEKLHVNNQIKETNTNSSLVNALQSPPKNFAPNHVMSPQPQQLKPTQPSAMVQPSIQQHSPQQKPSSDLNLNKSPPPKVNQHKIVQPIVPHQNADSNGTNQDVDKLLGQLLEESNNINIITSSTTSPVPPPNVHPQQRIHTIQLTPQKQQHLKNIQLQIQTLSARLTPGDTELQNTLKILFAEQQKILATGKLLPPDKVYYHNNQLTIVNPSSLTPSGGGTPHKMEASPAVQSNNAGGRPDTISSNHQVATTQSMPVPRISVSVPATEPPAVAPHPHTLPNAPTLPPRYTIPQQVAPRPQQPTPQQQFNSLAKKSHLIEAQLNLDQNGAIKPDIHTPFRDKKDACIRLIRYHVMDQPLLSEKDLSKADEIFELNARHFITKYAKMMDKYKYLLMKESMRQVRTSELMMLDRMHVNEEQQVLMKLRQEAEEAQFLDLVMPMPEPAPPPAPPQPAPASQPGHLDDYDEWACIQRELGCIAPESPKLEANQTNFPPDIAPTLPQPPHSLNNNNANTKRSSSSDSRLETLKRFRVDKHNKKAASEAPVGSVFANSHSSTFGGSSAPSSCNAPSREAAPEMENNSIDEQVQSAIDSILNLQQSSGNALDLDSILS